MIELTSCILFMTLLTNTIAKNNTYIEIKVTRAYLLKLSHALCFKYSTQICVKYTPHADITF